MKRASKSMQEENDGPFVLVVVLVLMNSIPDFRAKNGNIAVFVRE
jgi:hypothetical protein